MQSLFLLSLISSALPSQARARSPQLFEKFEPEHPSRWSRFAASVALHLLALAVVPHVASALANPAQREAEMRQERLLRTLRIRVPEQLYIASTGAQNQPKKRALRYRRKTAQAMLQEPAKQASAPGARKRGRRQRRFDLPVLPHRSESVQSIVQAQYPAQLLPPLDLRLPEVFFWSPALGPRPFAQAVVQPGHATPPTQPRILDAEPRLELPAPAYAELPLNSLPAEVARLLVAGSTDSLPIRTTYPDQLSQHTGISADPLAGDPANVLSITANPLPLREFLTIPPGNQAGQSSLSGAEAPGWAGGAARGSGSSGDSDSNGGGGEGAGEQGGTARASVGRSGGTGETDGLPPEDAMTGASSLARSAAVEATRVVNPSNGVFDVVVQSSGLEGFPESAGVLSGQPIYSVYLTVGARKDWILQYCIPYGEAQTTEISGGVVRLGTPVRPKAPYPLTTYRPPFSPRPGGYLMVHGFVDADGHFQGLRVLGKGDPRENAVVLAVLERWKFRPSTQLGVPVRVEVLLAIPSD
jgi:hypothetical protein